MKNNFEHKKIFTLEDFLEYQKNQKDVSFVFTNGCFDLLHAGHVDLLSRAKSYGDLLIVGLNSDCSVKRLKGEKRPIYNECERAFLLANLSCVDYVIIFKEDTPLTLIENIKPNTLIKGGDWDIENIVGKKVLDVYNGKVLSLPLLAGYSTSTTIENILKKYS